MGQQVTELITKFSFTGSLSKLSSFNQGMSTGIKITAGMSAALLTGTVAITKWSSSVLQALDPLAQMEKRTDVAAGRIQELSFIATQSGSTVDAMMGSILSLSQTIGDAAIKGSEDFSRLGISVRGTNGEIKNADQILGEVGSRFRDLNLSMQEQESIASSLGIDTSLVQLLNRSSGEMADLAAQARAMGTITKDQTELVAKYNSALNKQKFAVSAVKQQIALGFAPTLIDLTDRFTDLIAENRDWITGTAAKTIDVVFEIGDAMKNAAMFAFEFADAITFGNGKLALFAAAATAFAVSNPVVATIAGIILVIDDLVTAFRGGNSVIANFFEDNFGVDIVKQITDFNNLIMETIDAVNFLTGNTGHVAASIPQSLTQSFDEIPLGYGQSGTQVIDRAINQTVDININTNDPQAAGRAVVDGLQSQLDNANVQLNVGGM